MWLVEQDALRLRRFLQNGAQQVTPSTGDIGDGGEL